MAARTFEQPLMQALLPAMAPRTILNRAIAAHVSARHLAVLIGPSLGGVLYIFGPVFDYGICTALVLAAFVATLLLPDPGRPEQQPDVSLDTILAGFRFIWRCEAILGAMLFEFAAALFGTVSALFPIYARDILQTGAWGAGVLRSAPALGALIGAAAAHPLSDPAHRRASGSIRRLCAHRRRRARVRRVARICRCRSRR